MVLRGPRPHARGARQRVDARGPQPGVLPEFYRDTNKTLEDAKEQDKHPVWLGLGIVYEHIHSAKTIKRPSTPRLVPEQHVVVNAQDAGRVGLENGERMRIVSRRSSYEARIAIVTSSMERPARSEAFPVSLFSPRDQPAEDG